jgi:hypothetical protein
MFKIVRDVAGNTYKVPCKDEPQPRQEYLSVDEFNQLSEIDQELYIAGIRLRERNWMGDNRVK